MQKKSCDFCGEQGKAGVCYLEESFICYDCVQGCIDGENKAITNFNKKTDSFGGDNSESHVFYFSQLNNKAISLETIELCKYIMSKDIMSKKYRPKNEKENNLRQLLNKYKNSEYVKSNNNFLSENFDTFLNQSPLVGFCPDQKQGTFIFENSCLNDLGSFNPKTDYLIAINDILTINNAKFDINDPISLKNFLKEIEKIPEGSVYKNKIKNMTMQPFHFYKYNEEKKEHELKSELGMFYYIFKRELLEKMAINAFSESDALDSFIGQEKAKTHAKQLLAQSKVSRVMIEKGIKIDPIKLNTLFVGAPGTGKTSFAKILGKMLHKENLLSKGDFFLVTKSNLVGEYIGHTENLVKKVVANAKGSVLFIDEAYNLIPKNDSRDFGQQALQTLMEEIDKCENDIMVIFGGYEHEIERILEVNDGYKRRFPHKIVFENYNSSELLEISKLKMLSYGLELNENQNQLVLTNFEKVLKIKNFGNGGYVTNLLEKISLKKSLRLANNSSLNSLSKEELLKVEDLDIELAISELSQTLSSKKENEDNVIQMDFSKRMVN